MGSGFLEKNETVYNKFGTFAIQPLEKDAVTTTAWSTTSYLSGLLMTLSDLSTFAHQEHPLTDGQKIQAVTVQAPAVPNEGKTLGGPVYISVGHHLEVKSPLASDPESTTFKHSNSLVEYYYYKQPQVSKVQPRSGLTSGGTPIEISGVWFDFKPEYGLIPHCDIGGKIVRATFYSTVRLVCHAPPSSNINEAVPIKLSLNGVDFIDTGATFSYYNPPQVSDIFPKSGSMSGGTEVYLIGENFSNITTAAQTKCKFHLFDQDEFSKRGEVSKTIPASYINETTMVCASPSGFIGNDKTYVSLTFNNHDYSEENSVAVYQFYQVFGSFPHSGPTSATPDDVILIKGAGFKSTSRVLCSMNRVEVPAIEVTPNLIKCPMLYPDLEVGAVAFGISLDGTWVSFGDFFYYKQIALDEVQPNYGPA